ncbi:hypothetical protein D3C81_1466370 [compost metagenome]
MVGGLHVHSESDGDSGQDDDGETRQLLELIDQPLSAIGTLTAGTGVTVDDRRPKSEMLLNRVLQFTLNITQFGKDDDLVTVTGPFYRLESFHQPLQFRRIVAQPRVWLNAIRMGTNQLEFVKQPKHAGGLLIELLFDLLLLAVCGYFGQVQIALQSMHAK